MQCQQTTYDLHLCPVDLLNMCDLAGYEAARADLISAIICTTCARLFYGLGNKILPVPRGQGTRCEVGLNHLACGSSVIVKTRQADFGASTATVSVDNRSLSFST